VDDLIDAFLLLMQSSDDFTGPVNLGNPVEFTMLELAEQVKELTNSSSEIRFDPLPEDDPKQRQPDISLAKDKLGWEPKVPLREGLEKTITYFSELLKAEIIK
jgi:UDP-glucuronate decarboxylase